MLTRTRNPQKKYAGCPICHSKLRPLLEGEILMGEDLMLLSHRYEISQRDVNKHLHHMRDKLVAEVSKDAEEVLARLIERMGKKWEEVDSGEV